MPLQKMRDMTMGLDSPFFRPLWVRVATVASCPAWAGVEFATGGAGWAVMFAAVGLFAAWQFRRTDWAAMDGNSTIGDTDKKV